jgi:hypothetical protein
LRSYLCIFSSGKLADHFADSDFDQTKPTSNPSAGVCTCCQPLRYDNDISCFYLVRRWGSNASHIHFTINGGNVSHNQCLGDRSSFEHDPTNWGCGISF